MEWKRLLVPLAAIAVAVVVLVVGRSCSGGEPESVAEPTGQTHGSALPAGEAADVAEPVAEEESMHVSPVQITGTERAVAVTSKGAITFEFYGEDAPNTVASFVELADTGFYDGIKFHRVIPGFVAQAGDPQTRALTVADLREGVAGVGTGGPGWTLEAEFNSRKHETGTLAMARARDVNSAGSQFYICLAPQPSLDGQYTVFGRVVEGMDVVMALEVGDEIESLSVTR